MFTLKTVGRGWNVVKHYYGQVEVLGRVAQSEVTQESLLHKF